jgi:4-amino-4-deoxy-L-arabinose transferase-like glycosyltransferase
LTGDEVGYNKMVYQLLDEGVYGYAPYKTSVEPNAFTTPGYPLFLALCYKMFGYHDGQSPTVQIQAVQIAIQLGCSIMLYLIALQLFKKRSVGLLLMAGYLIHPTLILTSSYLLTETLYGFFNLLFIYLLIDSINKQRRRTLFLAGATLAVCVLIRPAIMPFLFLLIAYLYWMNRGKSPRQTIAAISCLVAGFTLLMLPWWIRNFITLHKMVWLAEQAGNPLLWGAFPNNPFPSIDPLQDSSEMGKIAIQRIINGFKTEPLIYLEWYTWGKIKYLVTDVFPGGAFITKGVFQVTHIVMVLLGVMGLIVAFVKKQRSTGVILALFFLTNVVVYLPFAPVSRYFYSALPLCLIGLGQIVDFLSIWLSQRKSPPYSPSAPVKPQPNLPVM